MSEDYVYILFKNKEVVYVGDATRAEKLLVDGLGINREFELYKCKINGLFPKTKKPITRLVDIYEEEC